MATVCLRCGNDEMFVRTSVVQEIALYNGAGEFVEVIDAEVKDMTGEHCRACDSEDLAQVDTLQELLDQMALEYERQDKSMERELLRAQILGVKLAAKTMHIRLDTGKVDI